MQGLHGLERATACSAEIVLHTEQCARQQKVQCSLTTDCVCVPLCLSRRCLAHAVRTHLQELLEAWRREAARRQGCEQGRLSWCGRTQQVQPVK